VTAPLSRQNLQFLLYDWLDAVDLTTRDEFVDNTSLRCVALTPAVVRQPRKARL
jgi:Acyl-CoA dehydrogenase N terminal